MEDCKLSKAMDDIYTYSIIIPHKNCPDLLRRCLDSIPHRDDVQIIVVDDNSDPSKVDFNHFPGMGESNTEVFLTKEGRGAGYARNVGLRYAKGKWLLFADADDYLADGCFSYIDDYKNSVYDIVYFATTSIYPETGEMAMRHIWNQGYINEALSNDNYDLLKYKNTSPVAKMVRRSLVQQRNIFFDEIIAANDAMFSIKTAYYANSIAADKRVIYVITVRSGSLEYTISKEVLLCRISVDYAMNKFFRKNGIKERVCALRYIMPLRKVSYQLLLQQLICYLLKNPLCFLFDFLDLFRMYWSKMKVQKSRWHEDSIYMKIEK